jgi:hypothetical protein
MNPIIHRASLSPIVFALLVAGAHEARGAEPPKLSALPVGRVTTAPTKAAPPSIGARESVPGFYVAAPQYPASVPVRHRSVTVIGDPKVAEGVRTNRHVEDRSNVCYAERSFAVREASEMAQLDPKALEWGAQSSFSSRTQLMPPSKDNWHSGIAAIHSERVIEQNGVTSLESVDAWVDPTTKGARLIGKASLPLTLVGSTPFGVKVFAGRDERADGKRFVQFVLVQPPSTDLAASILGSQMWAARTSVSRSQRTPRASTRSSRPRSSSSRIPSRNRSPTPTSARSEAARWRPRSPSPGRAATPSLSSR